MRRGVCLGGQTPSRCAFSRVVPMIEPLILSESPLIALERINSTRFLRNWNNVLNCKFLSGVAILRHLSPLALLGTYRINYQNSQPRSGHDPLTIFMTFRATGEKCDRPEFFWATAPYKIMNMCIRQHAHLLPAPQTESRPGDELPRQALEDEEYWEQIGNRHIPGVQRPEGRRQPRADGEQAGNGENAQAFIKHQGAKLRSWARDGRPLNDVKGMIKGIPRLAQQLRPDARPPVLPKILPGAKGAVPRMLAGA